MHRPSRFVVVAALVLASVTPMFALELRVSALQATPFRVSLVVELRELLRDKFLETVQQGRAVFLQMQAEVWEDRRIADRLALTTPQLTYRVNRAEAGVTITDQRGNVVPHADLAMAFPITLDVGPASGLLDDAVYYVRAEVTAATFAERDIDRMGIAIFGDDDSIAGLANLGRYLFGTALRIGRYLDSATAEVTSARYTGLQIKTGRR
jgi:hypothetical protein